MHMGTGIASDELTIIAVSDILLTPYNTNVLLKRGDDERNGMMKRDPLMSQTT